MKTKFVCLGLALLAFSDALAFGTGSGPSQPGILPSSNLFLSFSGLATNTNEALNINTAGDTSGTNAINIYSQGDAYLPSSAIGALTSDGATPGWTSSCSGGTGPVPTSSANGALCGGFSMWSYQSSSPNSGYYPIGFISAVVNGSTANNRGGLLNFNVKLDGGALVQSMSLDGYGALDLSVNDTSNNNNNTATGITVTLSDNTSGSPVNNAQGIIIQGANISGSVSGNTVLPLQIFAPTISGTSSESYTGLKIGMPIITSSNGFTTLVRAIDIGAPSIAVAGTVTTLNAFNIANQGGAGIGTSNAINIATQSGSVTASNAIKSNGFTLDGSGNVTPNSIIGVTTNSSAPAGAVGELISATVLTGSAVALTSPTPKDVTTISLTAGDWDVWGTVCFTAGGSTTATQFSGAIGGTANTLPTAPGGGAIFQEAISVAAGATEPCQSVGMTQELLSATTTIHLVAQSTFAVSTMSAYGYIGARRRR